MSNRIGQQVGNYRLVHLLGSGGFADVYLGQQVYIDSPAAIKMLRTNLSQEDMGSFRAEARTLVRLIHPHIVRLLDFGQDGNIPFLVMDYAPNGTLRNLHPRGQRLPLDTIVNYVNQIASALQYAHDQKVIHRDIKPENMLLGRQNEILLTDFGIAVVFQSTRTQLTQETTGTIAYMAPEQIQAHARPASDQYSLGVVVYEWLSGYRPFSGSFTEIAAKHLMTPPPPLRGQIPDISPEIEQVVFTALAKDPKDRFSSVRAFATALEQSIRAAQAGSKSPAQQQIPPEQTLAATGISTQPPSGMGPKNTFAEAEVAHPTEPAPSINTPSELFSSSAFPTVMNTPVIMPEIVLPQREKAPAPLQPAPPGASREVVGPASIPSTPPIQPHISDQARHEWPAAPPRTPPPSQPQPARRGVSRRAVLAGLAGVVVVAAAGGVTLAIVSHSSPPSTGQTTGATLLAQDNFQRGNQNGWGTAQDGFNWQVDANTVQDFSIVNGVGQIHQVGNGGELTAILGPNFNNADLLVSGSVSNFTNSQLGIVLRWTDDAHYYKAYIDGSNFILLRRQGNLGLALHTLSYPAQATTSYTIRFRVVGNALAAKVWRTGDTEPANWMLRATDNVFHAGRAGLRSNVNTGVTLQITQFTLSKATGL